MIYCVIPEALADELFDKMASYYAGDANVEVIINRRRSSRRGPGAPGEKNAPSEQRAVRDRRRARVPGDIPDTPAAGA